MTQKQITLQPRQTPPKPSQRIIPQVPVHIPMPDEMQPPVIDPNSNLPINPKKHPDTEDMWNLIKPGAAATPKNPPRGKFVKGPGKKKENPPAVMETAASGMTGIAQEATEIMPDAPVNAAGKVIAQMPGQPAAVMPQIVAQAQPAPPKSRQEYLQQQQQMSGFYQYPDVAEVFSGKVPGVIPLNHQEPPAPSLPTARTLTEVTVHHQMPERARAYMALQQFTICFDGVTSTFLKDALIYDVNMIDYLLMTGCTMIAPACEVENWIQCPNCRHNFPPEAGKRRASAPGMNDLEAFARGVGLRPRTT